MGGISLLVGPLERGSTVATSHIYVCVCAQSTRRSPSMRVCVCVCVSICKQLSYSYRKMSEDEALSRGKAQCMTVSDVRQGCYAITNEKGYQPDADKISHHSVSVSDGSMKQALKWRGKSTPKFFADFACVPVRSVKNEWMNETMIWT